MKCQCCGHSGFKRNELNDYYGDGVLMCGPCCDDHDITDKHINWEKDEEPLDEDDDQDE